MYSLYRSTLLQSHQAWLKAHLKIVVWFFSLWCTELWWAAQMSQWRRTCGPSCWVGCLGILRGCLGGEGGLLKMVPFLPGLISHGWSLRDDLGLASSTRLQTTLKGHSTSSTFLYPVPTSLSFLPALIPRWPLNTHTAGKGHHSVCNLNCDTIFY